MKKKNQLNQLYKHPLPIHVVPLPQLVLHNPISVLWFVWSYLFPQAPVKVSCTGTLSSCKKFVKVTSENDMEALWSMGFFGKGTLSRSEPTWHTRTARRLNLKGSEKVTAEDITNARRRERQKFKDERAKADKLELLRRQGLDGAQEVLEEQAEVQEQLAAAASSQIRPEDQDIINGDELIQKEFLQLSPYEAVFLSYGLGVLTVDGLTTRELVDILRKDEKFLYQYVAYHHYRSKGWCVRSGVKFGVDWLLYLRGPPFSHAEFAMMVMPIGLPDETQSWWWHSNIGRVIGGVKKTLVYAYVELPSDLSQSLDEILRQSSVKEVVYRRWIPTRNRD